MRLPESYPPQKRDKYALSVLTQLGQALEAHGNSVGIYYMECLQRFNLIINDQSYAKAMTLAELVKVLEVIVHVASTVHWNG